MKMSLNPPVFWAQRREVVYVSIQLENIVDEKITVDNTKLEFSCKAGAVGKDYHVELKFFKDIVPEESKQKKLGREYFFQLAKKETGSYWPRLLENKAKPSFLKVDFNRWKDEDDSDNEGGVPDEQGLEDLMKQMGDGSTGFDPGSAPDSDDTDDEGLPGLE